MTAFVIPSNPRNLDRFPLRFHSIVRGKHLPLDGDNAANWLAASRQMTALSVMFHTKVILPYHRRKVKQDFYPQAQVIISWNGT